MLTISSDNVSCVSTQLTAHSVMVKELKACKEIAPQENWMIDYVTLSDYCET